jgi:hypothetical protein
MVHVLVPLQSRSAPHGPPTSSQLMLVPPQLPHPLHLSLYVQLLLSLQAVEEGG